MSLESATKSKRGGPGEVVELDDCEEAHGGGMAARAGGVGRRGGAATGRLSVESEHRRGMTLDGIKSGERTHGAEIILDMSEDVVEEVPRTIQPAEEQGKTREKEGLSREDIRLARLRRFGGGC